MFKRLKSHLKSPGEPSLPSQAQISEQIPVYLPPELWDCIAGFLSLKDLSSIYWLSRSFYDAYLRLKYACVVLDNEYQSTDSHIRACILLLRALQNPKISANVQSLFIRSDLDDALISSGLCLPKSSRAWLRDIRYKDSPENEPDIVLLAQNAMAMLRAVTHITLTIQKTYSQPLMHQLWSACSTTIVSLNISCSHDTVLSVNSFSTQDTVVCPNLRILRIYGIRSLDSAIRDTYAIGSFLSALRRIIPEDGGSMEELSLTLNLKDPSGTWAGPSSSFPSFGPITKLSLEGYRDAMPSILPYLASHRQTLKDISLGPRASHDVLNLTSLNPAILTSLSVYAAPFIDHQDRMFSFLSRCVCLAQLAILHYVDLGPRSRSLWSSFGSKLLSCLSPTIKDLDFPSQVAMSELFLMIARNLPNISSVALHGVSPDSNDHETREFFLRRSWNIDPPQLEAHTIRIGWVLRFKGLDIALDEYKQAVGRQYLMDEDLSAISEVFVRCTARLSKCCVF